METTATTAPTAAETVPEVTEVVEETVAETTVETTMETAPKGTEALDDYYWDDLPGAAETTEDALEATEPIMIIEETEASETTDTTAILVQIEENTAVTAEASGYIAGFSLFNVVVILCFFAYKFLRIFF